MANFMCTIDVASSPRDAFSFLCDPRNRAEWDPSVRQIAARDGADGQVGDRYDVTVGFYGKAVEAVYEIEELESPGRIVFATTGKVRGRDVIEIAPSATGSTIALDLDVQLGGVAKLLDRGLQVALSGIGENAANKMKLRLDQG